MSFGPPSKFNGVPVYHRPISSQGLRAPFATDALPTAAMQTAHFVTDGRGHFQASRSLSQTQPIIAKPIRGTSASGHREVSYAPVGAASARSQLSRTQPLDRGMVSHMGGGGGSVASLLQQSQSGSNPPWQHYRGPVAAVHRPAGGGSSQRASSAVRPHSSASGVRPGPNGHAQSYNIITGIAASPSPAASSWEDPRHPHSHPVVVEQAGGRIYQSVLDVDSMQTVPVSASSSGRRASGRASQRSQSVDRGSARANSRAPQQAYANGHASFDPSSSARFSQTQPLQQPYAHAYTNGGGNGFARTQSLHSTMDLGSTRSFSSTHGVAPVSSTLTSRPGSSGSDDGASFLEVGVAEDPNPRFRPTMEDAHIVKVGDWIDEPMSHRAPPQHGGAKPYATRRSYSHDLSRSASQALRRPTPVSSASANGQTAKSGYFAIYDGHGGREAVDYIERNLHKQLARQLKTGAQPAAALEAAFLETDAAMQATRQYQDSGSTVASALIRPSVSRAGQRDLFVANVGDARAVVAVGASGAAPLQAVRLSRDHTPNDPSEADRVRRAGGAVFRGRVDGQLAVSRAIGDHSLKRSGVSAQPHQQHLPLTKDHKFMIVACDGLWDVMTDAEAVNLISGMKDANRMADKLVKTAMQRGTTDNVSAMVVRLQK